MALNNLAILLLEDDRRAEAEPLFLRAVAILEQAHGPDHPEVAVVVLVSYAVLLQEEGRAIWDAAPGLPTEVTGPVHPPG
jgi:hypothetical protein